MKRPREDCVGTLDFPTCSPGQARPPLGELRQALAAGRLSDEAFDALLPDTARTRSRAYWTPLAVAQRAAAMLSAQGARHVLDVGCGPGKFCLAAAAAQPALAFHGTERRPPLVEVAEKLAVQLGLPNATFACGDALERSWDGFDAFYFFNPFWENVCPNDSKFDQTVELSADRLLREESRTSHALRGLPKGSFLVSYHGIGAPIPSGYELVESEPAGTSQLRVWRRERNTDAGWFHMETMEGVRRVTPRQLQAAAVRWRKLFE